MTHLTIESQEKEHEEETYGPERSPRHHCQGLWVGDERELWSYGKTQCIIRYNNNI